MTYVNDSSGSHLQIKVKGCQSMMMPKKKPNDDAVDLRKLGIKLR